MSAISAQGMIPFLRDGSFSGNIFVYDSLGSTNEHAKELARSGAEHGTIVIARSQTSGKGRRGRSFFSPPGHGIYMSLILHPPRLLYAQAFTTIFAAVAVCEAIEAVSGTRPRIKWVNDIFIDGKKVCGILTETVADSNNTGKQLIILGIGINFSVPETGFPEDLSQVAGAIFASPDIPVTKDRLAAQVANLILASQTFYSEKELLQEYRKRLLMLGEKILVVGSSESYEAVAIDIDDAGHLLVENETGNILRLSSGEISIRNP